MMLSNSYDVHIRKLLKILVYQHQLNLPATVMV
jgi:hypothetical protein